MRRPAAPRSFSARGYVTQASSRGSREYLVVLAGLAIAGLIYRPWWRGPLRALDFGEWFVALSSSSTWHGQLAALTTYHAAQARTRFLADAQIAGSWWMFGGDGAGWFIINGLLIAGVCFLTYILLRKLSITALAAALAVGLFVVATPAARVWTRYTFEPAGTCLIVLSLIESIGYREAQRWHPRAAAIVALVLAAAMTKEVLVGAMLPALVVACCWQRGSGLRWPSPDRRTWFMVSLSAVSVLLFSVFIMFRVRAAPEGSYGGSYGAAPLGTRTMMSRLPAFLLPFQPFANEDSLVASALFILLTFAGLVRLIVVRNDAHRVLLRTALVGLVISVVGLTVYAP